LLFLFIEVYNGCFEITTEIELVTKFDSFKLTVLSV